MKPLRILYLFSFFLAVQFAVTTYINSTFLALFIGEKNVGLIYALGSTLAIIGLLFLPRFTVKIGNFKVVNLILFAMLFSLVGLFQAKNITAGLFFIFFFFSSPKTL